VKLIATLDSEVLTIQGMDVRLPKKAPNVVHLLGGEGLKELTLVEVTEVDAGFPQQGPCSSVEEDDVIGAGETPGHMQSDLHFIPIRDRDRILEAGLEEKGENGEGECRCRFLHDPSSIEDKALVSN
jgi:hypothetical protein